MSEQKTEKSAAKPSSTKSASAGKDPAAEKKPAARERQPGSARDTEPKDPKPTGNQATSQPGRLASRRVWPD